MKSSHHLTCLSLVFCGFSSKSCYLLALVLATIAAARVIVFIRFRIGIHRYHLARVANSLAVTCFAGIFSVVVPAVTVFSVGGAKKAPRTP